MVLENLLLRLATSLRACGGKTKSTAYVKLDTIMETFTKDSSAMGKKMGLE